MKLIKKKLKENLSIIATILSIIAIVGGAIPNIVGWIQDISESPNLQLIVKETNTHDACVVTIYNYGNKNAEEVALKVMVVDEQRGIISTNSSIIFPVLPKWSKEDPIILQHVTVKFEEGIMTGSYLVKTFAKSKDGATAEREKTIDII